MDTVSIGQVGGILTTSDTTFPPINFGQHRVVVVIPAFNEERFIGSVVIKVKRYSVTVIVVDDGSTDDTAAIAASAGAIVVRQPKNMGKGEALNAGFRKAFELKPEAIVMIDADGQHLPEELQAIVRPILNGEADVVVGSRYKKKYNVPIARIFGHIFFNLLTSSMSGVFVSDSQSGYRAFSPRALENTSFHSKGFSVESEMQFLAHEKHLRVLEVPITIQYTDPPKRSVFHQGLSVLNGVLRLTGQYRPLLFFGVTGLVMLIAGVSFGFVIVDRYVKTQQLATGYGLICVLLSILGLVMMSTGITLHSIRGLLQDIRQDINNSIHHSKG